MAFSRLYRRDSVGGYDEERFQNEVDSELLCPICLKVLKDPVQCPNEHYFCRSCIEKHLHENSETCPTCQHHLTETTLTKPPRILIQMLLGLKIRCDYNKRGCGELIKLEFLNRHIENCGYLPTRCTHPGCSQDINQRDKERHESELCRFRMVVCDDCGQEILRKLSRIHACFMRKEMDCLAKDMSEVNDDVKQMKLNQEEFIKEVKNMIKAANQDDVADDLRRRNERMRHEMDTMRAEMACLTKEATERSEWYTGRQRIFVCGGRDENRHNSVESYSWPDNAWRKEPAMKEVRSGASAFVHEGQMFVTGGRNQEGKDTDSIESLNVDKEHIEWIKLPVQMPIKCAGHRMICQKNNAILTGGQRGKNVSGAIHKIQLNPPYNTNVLTQMPEPRCYHGCEIIENQVVIAGGMTSTYLKDIKNTMYLYDIKNTMYLYDINNNECKAMTPLPFAISEVATAGFKDNVILIGGVNKIGQTLNTVMMYDLKTGKTKMLPCLNHNRAQCAAVIIGNVILVMGGYDYQTDTYLKSVECLDLNANVWRELSPMTTKRGFATAVVKSIC